MTLIKILTYHIDDINVIGTVKSEVVSRVSTLHPQYAIFLSVVSSSWPIFEVVGDWTSIYSILNIEIKRIYYIEIKN